jgi:hypothetical protein
MRTRADWSPAEWAVCFLCMLGSTGLLVLAFLAHKPMRLTFLLVGASVILAAISWAPNLLLRPTVPQSPRDMAPVEIPRIASFTVTLGVYLLLVGTVVAWVFRNEL